MAADIVQHAVDKGANSLSFTLTQPTVGNQLVCLVLCLGPLTQPDGWDQTMASDAPARPLSMSLLVHTVVDGDGTAWTIQTGAPAVGAILEISGYTLPAGR